jgi:hypothetical protein
MDTDWTHLELSVPTKVVELGNKLTFQNRSKHIDQHPYFAIFVF